ncbi:helix-turn-helix transcriptional regulator [Sphingobacterium psychroaquaticum]|uniref:AraC-type DNA-binding protein n=1 Tax=Sphingobacterium psychroaquaticum TaxID=561061 RepID=A0A1X7JAJ7_9SPHI|nr:AraC family transcriptional regulator [Sphingobacterium psychroaquaticum]QBQ39982.1 helix-turn-helix domain-containing protein [Sphingobacterium psychroaquaticum]SMG24377.1 AraC-type DNA-binding protein [Sphingobacterium psychroaquaticum]
MNLDIRAVETFNLTHFKHEYQNDYRLLHHVVDGRNKISKPHKHDFYLLFLIEQGSGTHTIDFHTHKVQDRQLHILLPNQTHTWDLGEQTDGYQFMINQQVFESFQSAIHIHYLRRFDSQVFDLKEEAFNTLLHEFQQLNKDLQISQQIPWQIVYTRSQLLSLLISKEIETHLDGLVENKLHPTVLHFINLVDRHFIAQKTVAFYADKLHITANYLNILCKRDLQVSALHIIQQRVVQEAKGLLKNTNSSIKEIAYSLGFLDSSYFSNYFKNQVGTTPRQYQIQL